MSPSFLPSSLYRSSTFALCFSTGREDVEGGRRADDLGVGSEGGGLITLAFNPVGDSWYYRSDKQHFIHIEFKMYNLASDIVCVKYFKTYDRLTDTFGI